MLLFKIIALISVVSSVVLADVKRISSVYKDLGQSQKIYLHAGLISVVEFPQSILEVRLGNPKSIKAQLSQVSPRELTLYLSQQAVEPTNLIVKSEKRFYIFDIIPSKASHQDYVKISGAYGAPETASSAKGILVHLAPVKEKSKQPGRLVEAIKMGGE